MVYTNFKIGFSYFCDRPVKSLKMLETFYQDQTFNQNDLDKKPLEKGEYENCLFQNCNFTEYNLSEFKFLDCDFVDCNLSLAILNGTAFRTVRLKDCKMLGLQFDNCNDFGLAFSFNNCQLNHSVFFQLKIKKTNFKNCQLHETDFSEADLSNANFEDCDLSQAVFQNTNLEKADFRNAFNYSIDPESNNIKGAKFHLAEVSGLLTKYKIQIDI